MKQVSRELGVRYVLEGSVRRASNRVRITAQLVDAVSGGHHWGEHYDRKLGDVFAVQDEITRSVAAAIEPHLLAAEGIRALSRTPEHLGAWELSSFYHSLMGHPMGMVIRRLDNKLLDKFVNRIRCLHGNRVNHKDDFARGLITAIRQGDAVGILMDTNMTPPQGVFVDFFGRKACTASGLARVAIWPWR